MAVENHNRSEDTRPSEVAHRQSYVREVNEGAVGMPQNGDADEVSILCECGRGECTSTLQLNGEVYRSVRRQATWFIVVDGHEVPGSRSGEAEAWDVDDRRVHVLPERHRGVLVQRAIWHPGGE